MSLDLIKFLNGKKNGKLREYLNSVNQDINIAWYPSAGEDFRGLFYLSKEYSAIKPAAKKETLFPDFFIFTDYFPWSSSTFLDDKVIYKDSRTEVSVNHIEELPSLDLPLDEEIVNFPNGNSVNGKVIFLEIQVVSEELGTLTKPVIYAFVENEPFCSKILLEKQTKLSHIIHIRYGGGLGGGGHASGVWLLNVLKKLNCQVFITDGHYSLQDGDEAAYRLYPNLKGTKPKMEVIKTLESESWSGHGKEVTWNIFQ